MGCVQGRVERTEAWGRFADAVAVFADESAVTVYDPEAGEERYVTMGMRSEYDFRGARRGAIDPAPAGKTRITIRLDNDVLEWFRGQVEAAGGGNYQSLINAALRQYIAGADEPIEETLRRVVREELDRSG